MKNEVHLLVLVRSTHRQGVLKGGLRRFPPHHHPNFCDNENKCIFNKHITKVCVCISERCPGISALSRLLLRVSL